MSSPSTNATTSAPRLRRTLTLSDLILYGIIVIQPVAPMSVFGVLSDRGRGHVVTTLLIADSDSAWLAVPPEDGDKGGIANIRSGAPGTGRNGTPYAEW